MNEEKLKIFQDNHGWVAVLFTGMVFVIQGILKMTEYWKYKAYFAIFGLDINLFKFNDKFFNGLSFSILLAACLYSIIYCIYHAYINLKNNKLKTIFDLVIIICGNIFFTLLFSNDGIVNKIVCFISLMGIEVFFTFISVKFMNKKDDTENLKEYILNNLKVLPFLLVTLLLYSLYIDSLTLEEKKDYRIINDSKVIVYSTEDYYLTLDCKIQDQKLIIYKGTQEKIDNNNIYSKYKKFEEVLLKEGQDDE